MADIHQYKCKNCMGKVQFDSETQMMKCPYCESIFDLSVYMEEEQALKNKAIEEGHKEDVTEISNPEKVEILSGVADIKSMPTTDAATKDGKKKKAPHKVLNYNKNLFKTSGRKWEKDDLSHLVVYHCDTCGGEQVSSADTGATRCPYCDHQMVVSNAFEGELRPEMIIPFQVNQETAAENYKKYIEKRKFLPKEFKNENHIKDIQGVYVPYWVFSADLEAQIQETDTTQRFYTRGNYNYTETTYYDVRREGNASYKDVPADASTKMDDFMMESIEPFNLADAKDFSNVYLAGYMASRYDVTPSECMDHVMYRVVESTYSKLNHTIKGYTGKVSCHKEFDFLSGSVKYALFPVWLLNTTYRGENYTFAMNGQTGKFTGNLPKDKTKMILVALAISAGSALLLTLLLLLLGLMVLAPIIGIAGGCAIGFGIVWGIAGKLNGIKEKKEANDYITDFQLTYKHDRKIRTQTTKTKRD